MRKSSQSPVPSGQQAVRRKPEWLKVRAPGGPNYVFLKDVLKSRGLHTVCEEARCPNVGECWNAGTATFMILGDTCTRACKFCAVKTGNPRRVVDQDEPRRVAEAVAAMKLRYVVLTSVDRDDLPDQGSEVFARTVQAIKHAHPDVLVESLIPDFRADRECLRRVAEAGGEVVAHNVETTRALTRSVRDLRCDFDQSLRALALLKEMAPGMVTKSSIMLGLGETEDDVVAAMRDLRSVQVDIVTLGQYLQPTPHHHPVIEYHAPEVFDRLRVRGLELGFRFIAAGPLVRSSYRAAEAFLERELRGHG